MATISHSEHGTRRETARNCRVSRMTVTFMKLLHVDRFKSYAYSDEKILFLFRHFRLRHAQPMVCGASAGFLATGEQKMASRSMGASGATNAKVTLGTITPAVGRRSSCGNQVSSTDNSHPSYGFGASCLQTCLQQPIARIHVSTCSAPRSAACARFSIDSLPLPFCFRRHRNARHFCQAIHLESAREGGPA